jgi:hypothetical protein
MTENIRQIMMLKNISKMWKGMESFSSDYCCYAVGIALIALGHPGQVHDLHGFDPSSA